MPLWFGLILNDPTAFNGLMSLALGQQYRCHRIPTEQKFILYHTKALNAVQRRLSQPTAPTDFGLLTSIILFLMHDASDILAFDGLYQTDSITDPAR